MADKILNTRVQLKYDSLANWSTKNPTLLSGELAIVYLGNSNTTTTPDNGTHPILFKVGPGAFNSLPFASALAADVYSWAKETGLTITKDGTGNVVSGIEWDATANNGKGGIKFTTAAVATAEGLEELQEEIYGDNANGKSRIDLIEEDIAANRANWAEKTVDTNTDTQYRFTTDGDKLVVYKTLYTLGAPSAEEKVGEYEFLTAAEVTETLKAYYTSEQIDNLVKDKLHTQAEIESYIDTALAEVSNTDTIDGITTLVEYVNTHGSDLAAITKEIYGDSGKVGDDPSRIDTAVANAETAVNTANNASSVANTASGVANEAKELAQSAKETAETAQNSASASAQAAAASAEAAEASRSAADTSADVASGYSDSASASAGVAEEKAEEASRHASAANSAKEAAESAQAKAEAAQEAAEIAQAAAEQALSDTIDVHSNVNILANNAEADALAATEAKTAAEAAQAKAEEAQGKAEAAKSGAETAQSKAESAQAAAEAAQAAAEASNTSATAIANSAKSEAEAATAASNAATQAVAGLHDMATSGDLYDSENVGTAKNTAGTDVPCFIFYCGTASDLV